MQEFKNMKLTCKNKYFSNVQAILLSEKASYRVFTG